MNKPFTDVENDSFRELLFAANRNYLVPSRRTLQRKLDIEAVSVKEELRKEICRDLQHSKFISITSDHATSNDAQKTKKNVVTLSRTTSDFVIKTDTIGLITCEGSQTGAKIRETVRDALMDGKTYHYFNL